MTEKNKVKSKIIETTIKLIQENSGDTDKITARLIAKEANVSLGLINYHFGSKDQLITTCVQQIIDQVVNGTFELSKKKFHSDRERLTEWAVYVFEFLFANPFISKISIVGDMNSYEPHCNSIQTQQGFMKAFTENMPEEKKKLMIFMMVASMQVAFLGRDTVKGLLHYDFSKKSERRKYIADIVEMLMEREKSNELFNN